MAVVFPVPRIPIDFDVALLDSAFLKFDPGIFEIRPRLAVPLPEMHHSELLAAGGHPLRTEIAIVKTRLDFEFTHPGNGVLGEHRRVPGGRIGFWVVHRSGYGR
jgi:hypothetical protein